MIFILKLESIILPNMSPPDLLNQLFHPKLIYCSCSVHLFLSQRQCRVQLHISSIQNSLKAWSLQEGYQGMMYENIKAGYSILIWKLQVIDTFTYVSDGGPCWRWWNHWIDRISHRFYLQREIWKKQSAVCTFLSI